jgi:hypothetical protein
MGRVESRRRLTHSTGIRNFDRIFLFVFQLCGKWTERRGSFGLPRGRRSENGQEREEPCDVRGGDKEAVSKPVHCVESCYGDGYTHRATAKRAGINPATTAEIRHAIA